jgi:hypothetical protein
METAEMRFVITVTGCRSKDHKRDEDITEELGLTDIKKYEKKQLKHSEKMPRKRNPTLSCQHKQKGRKMEGTV